MSFPGAYLTLYCTDSLKMGAAFLGMMFLICRFLDGISDIVMGLIIDRTNTRFGKARPWFVGSMIPLVLSFIFIFNVPEGFSNGQRIAYIYALYSVC